MRDNSKLEDIFEDLLLEKDHTQTMIKFGVPEPVAKYLHDYDNNRSIWFANEFKKMPEFQTAQNKIAWIRSKANDMQSIKDWHSSVPNINLKKYSWQQALEASQQWHDRLSADKMIEKETNKVIQKYPDGFYWVDLEDTRCREEAATMGHCGTTNKADTLFSLRKYDPGRDLIDSHITMAISPDDEKWFQCKGKNNSKPKEMYWGYIADILNKYKCYTYNSEYNGQNDFKPENFKEYIEDHPDKFPNADEIIEMLNESGLQAKADKLFDKYKFKRFDISWEVSESDDYIYATAYGGFSFQQSMIENCPPLQSMKRSSLYEYVKDALDKFYIYPDELQANDGIQIDGNDVNVSIDIRKDDSYYSRDELSNFESFLDNIVEMDEKLDDKDFVGEFVEKFQEILEENDELLNPDEVETDPFDVYRKGDVEGQMKFKLESFSFKDYYKYLKRNN